MRSDRKPSTRTGIVLVIFGLALAAVTGAIMKLLSEQLHPVQITWFRFLGFALVLFPVVAARIGSSALRPGRPWMQVVRGLTMSSATVSFVVGARTVDYADAIAILSFLFRDGLPPREPFGECGASLWPGDLELECNVPQCP